MTAEDYWEPDAADPRDDPRRWLLPLLITTAAIATAVFGSRPMISYKAIGLGAQATEIGAIASAFSIFALLAAVPLGRSIDRLGERRVILVGCAVVAVTALGTTVADSLLALALSQAGFGLGQLMVAVSSHAVLANRGGLRGQEMRIGWYTSAAAVGHALGPAAGGLIAGEAALTTGTTPVFAGAAIVAALGIPLALLLPAGKTARHRARVADKPDSIPVTLRRPGILPAILTSVTILAGIDLLVAYMPVYGEERAISPEIIGFALAALSAFQVGSRVLMGRLIDRVGHGPVMAASMAIPALAIPFLVLDLDTAFLLVITAVVGMGLGVGQPLTLSWLAQAAPPGSRGLALGLRMAGSRLGQLLIPAGVGATAGAGGAAAVFVVVAGMLGLMAGYVHVARYSFRQRLPQPGDQS